MKKADGFIGHLLFAEVTVMFIGPHVVEGNLVSRPGVKSSVVPVLGQKPSTVRLLMRHDEG